MKLKEIKQPSEQALFEEINKQNETGFLTEDLVEVKRTIDSNDWHESMTSEQLTEKIKRLSNASI